MINNDDLEKAKQNIKGLCKLRDGLINSSPYLADIESRLDWYQKAISEIPEQNDNFLSLIESPVDNIISLTPTNLDFSSVTGVTGSFFSVSGDTREIITNYGTEHYDLILEYDNLKQTESLIDEITTTINKFRPELKLYKPEKLLIDAKAAFFQWKVDAIDNSDLAKEIRAFQDVFKGCLRDSWITSANLKNPDFSWNKMANALGKNSGGCKKELLKIKNAEDNFHSEFSKILKKTKDVSKEKMNELFKSYVEHLYSIVNLINMDLMN
jgi:hypothetical protein